MGHPHGGSGLEFLVCTTLEDERWLAWNAATWGLRPERVEHVDARKGYALRGVVYRDRRGRLRMPPLNPHLPFRFTTSGTVSDRRREELWLIAATALADQLSRERLAGRLLLPPGPWDVRPFRWAGLVADTRYTFTGRLPLAPDQVSRAIRKQVNKARRHGFTFAAERDAAQFAASLRATASRQGFDYRLNGRALAALFDVLDDRLVRGHAVRASTGAVVSAGVRLIGGGVAVDWVQGTSADALKHGAAQLVYSGAFEDLESLGVLRFDFAGANIRSVATAKAGWGMRVTPYIAIAQRDARQLLIEGRQALAAARRSRQQRHRSPE